MTTPARKPDRSNESMQERERSTSYETTFWYSGFFLVFLFCRFVSCFVVCTAKGAWIGARATAFFWRSFDGNPRQPVQFEGLTSRWRSQDTSYYSAEKPEKSQEYAFDRPTDRLRRKGLGRSECFRYTPTPSRVARSTPFRSVPLTLFSSRRGTRSPRG